MNWQWIGFIHPHKTQRKISRFCKSDSNLKNQLSYFLAATNQIWNLNGISLKKYTILKLNADLLLFHTFIVSFLSREVDGQNCHITFIRKRLDISANSGLQYEMSDIVTVRYDVFVKQRFINILRRNCNFGEGEIKMGFPETLFKDFKD